LQVFLVAEIHISRNNLCVPPERPTAATPIFVVGQAATVHATAAHLSAQSSVVATTAIQANSAQAAEDVFRRAPLIAVTIIANLEKDVGLHIVPVLLLTTLTAAATTAVRG
jgi:hypothetical protein